MHSGLTRCISNMCFLLICLCVYAPVTRTCALPTYIYAHIVYITRPYTHLIWIIYSSRFRICTVSIPVSVSDALNTQLIHVMLIIAQIRPAPCIPPPRESTYSSTSSVPYLRQMQTQGQKTISVTPIAISEGKSNRQNQQKRKIENRAWDPSGPSILYSTYTFKLNLIGGNRNCHHIA